MEYHNARVTEGEVFRLVFSFSTVFSTYWVHDLLYIVGRIQFWWLQSLDLFIPLWSF
jgi:hypothetical protein